MRGGREGEDKRHRECRCVRGGREGEDGGTGSAGV